MKKRTINKLVTSHPNPTTYVFLDTCAILDVLRLPAKYENKFSMLSDYRDLIAKVNHGDAVLVTSCMTYVELQSNKKNAIQTETDWENSLTKNLHYYEGFAREAGLIAGNGISATYDATDLMDHLNDMYNELTRRIFYLP